ncbi:MAG: TniQ family protein, partial [Promethearchaeota archaeon]
EIDLKVEEWLDWMEDNREDTSLHPQTQFHSWGKMLVHPKKGESFLSWLMRQAWMFNLTPLELLQSEQAYWLRAKNISLSLPRSGLWLAKIDVLPLDSVFNNIVKERGLIPKIETLQVDLSQWIDLAKLDNPRVLHNKLQIFYRFNLCYCPVCWNDVNTRYFRTQWRLPFILVCSEHGAILRELCPSCNKTLFDKSQLKAIQPDWFINCNSCGQSLLDNQIKENPTLKQLQHNIHRILIQDKSWGTSEGYSTLWNSYISVIGQNDIVDAEQKLKIIQKILQHSTFPNVKHICPYCGTKDIKSIRAFRAHVWACGQDRRCPQCNKADFGSKTSHDSHVAVCGQELICPTCGEKLTSKQGYDVHIWACGKEHKCPSCERTDFGTKRLYDDHVWICGKDISCDYCGLSDFTSRRAYNEHVRFCKQKKNCPHCGEAHFVSQQQYLDHIWVCENKPRCKICKKSDFMSRSMYYDHIWACKNKPVCPHCGRSDFTVRSNYNNHVWTCENKPSCPVCGESNFSYKTTYETHVKTCKKNNS